MGIEKVSLTDAAKGLSALADQYRMGAKPERVKHTVLSILGYGVPSIAEGVPLKSPCLPRRLISEIGMIFGHLPATSMEGHLHMLARMIAHLANGPERDIYDLEPIFDIARFALCRKHILIGARDEPWARPMATLLEDVVGAWAEPGEFRIESFGKDFGSIEVALKKFAEGSLSAVSKFYAAAALAILKREWKRYVDLMALEPHIKMQPAGTRSPARISRKQYSVLRERFELTFAVELLETVCKTAEEMTCA